jgi:hypothetical protein
MLEESILFSHQFSEYGTRKCPEIIVSEKEIDLIVLVPPAAQPTPNIMSRNGTSLFWHYLPSLDYMYSNANYSVISSTI